MESSLIGETLARKASDTTNYYAAWLRRGGDEATYAVDVIDLLMAGFELAIETKDSNQPDSAATTLGTIALSTKTVIKLTLSGAKELVRHVIRPTGSTATWMHFQILSPQWTTN
ncbi:MAG: hypothetical protein IT457_24815 [Planctomycetes bacterium]|nr:hypothetical protein [Planctomycetota bacterium]